VNENSLIDNLRVSMIRIML